MKTKKRQKICYNCNAQVDLEVIVCPYCGTDLLEEFDSEYESEEDLDSRVLSPQQTIASLYPPPYQTHNDDELKIEENIDKKINIEEEKKQTPSAISTVVLTFSASLIGLISLLFFFSVDGEISLSINNKYLVFIFIVALPAFFWSWKGAKDE